MHKQVGFFAILLKRLANSDLDKAIKTWDIKKPDFIIDLQVADRVERKLGMALLSKKDIRAYGHLAKVTLPDEEARTAKGKGGIA